ncbi:MAG: Lipopolysaccharide assembly protein B [Candidatus Methanogaster sp.]|nr:MAG: Lipopolysaccharide assembly protein B [ANME-2 cluster archaeon]
MNETSDNQHQVQIHNIYEELEQGADLLTVRAIRACAVPIRLDKELASVILNSKFVGCNGSSQEMLTQILRLPFVHRRPDGSFKYAFNARCYFDEQLRTELTTNGNEANDSYGELNQIIAEYFQDKMRRLNGDAPKGSYMARQLALSEAFHKIPADTQKGIEELGSFAAWSMGVNSLADTIAALNISKYREPFFEGKERLESNFIKAKFYYQTNNYNKALPLLERIYRMYMSPSYKSIFSSRAKRFMAAVSLHFLGYIQLKKGETAQSIKILIECIDIGRNLEEWYHVVVTLNTLGSAYIDEDSYDDAIEVLREGERLSKGRKYDSQLAIILNTLGNAYIKKKRYDDAIDVLRESGGLSKKLNDNSQLAITLTMLGYTYIGEKSYDDAIEVLREGERLSRKLEDDSQLARILNALGDAYIKKKRYDDAIDVLRESGGLSKKLNDNSQLAITLTMLGYTYIGEKSYDDAIEVLREGERLSRELNDNRQLARILNTLGSAYLKNKSPADAEISLRQCLELANESKDARMISRVYTLLGNACANLGRLEEAVYIYTEGAEFDERNGDMQHALDKQEWAYRLRKRIDGMSGH